MIRVSYRGGPGRGRGGVEEFPLPPSEILKLSMVIVVLSQVLNKVLSQIVSEAIWEDLNSGGACPRLPQPSTHTRSCMRECAFARCYHPATILFPSPSQLKILYETLMMVLSCMWTLDHASSHLVWLVFLGFHSCMRLFSFRKLFCDLFTFFSVPWPMCICTVHNEVEVMF